MSKLIISISDINISDSQYSLGVKILDISKTNVVTQTTVIEIPLKPSYFSSIAPLDLKFSINEFKRQDKKGKEMTMCTVDADAALFMTLEDSIQLSCDECNIKFKYRV